MATPSANSSPFIAARKAAAWLPRIGDGNLLMAYVHVAHDVIIHNHTILANGVTFAGHVTVEDYANIGGLSAIHQFCRIGRHALIGSRSVIKQNVLPYSITATDHKSEVYGANRIGLERSGFTADAIEPLQNAFRLLSNSGLNTTQALARIEEEIPQTDGSERIAGFHSRVAIADSSSRSLGASYGLIAGNGRFPLLRSGNRAP